MENYNKYITGLKRYIPALMLSINMTIVNFAFDTCINNMEYKIGFWVYYIILLLLTGIWEGFHSFFHFKTVYPHASTKSNIIYTIISTLTSIIVFFVLTYFVQNGKPFSCFYPYSHIIAGILFFLTCGVVSTITYIEHFFWGNLIKLDDSVE